MIIRHSVFAIPFVALAVACGGSQTPADAPEGAALEEESAMEEPAMEEEAYEEPAAEEASDEPAADGEADGEAASEE